MPVTTAGSGKTVFGLEFLYRGVTVFGENGVFVTFEERRTDLTKDLKLSPEDLEKIRWKNACNLLHIDPAKLGQTNKLAAE